MKPILRNVALALIIALLEARQAQAQAIPGAAGGITNPLGSGATIEGFIINAIQFLLGLSALLAFAAIIYGGFRLVASFGSDQNVQTGKKIVTWAIVGLVVIILAYTILVTVTRILGVGGL